MYPQMRSLGKPRSVTSVGRGLTIFLPAEYTRMAGIKAKDLVECWSDGSELLIKPVPKKMTIMERFEMYPSNYIQEEELDWGDNVGEEIICD